MATRVTALTTRRGGRGRGACPRASPAPGRPGWRGPPRRARPVSCCGAGISSAHGSRSPRWSSAVWTVKSTRRRRRRGRPSATGNDTGTPGPRPRAVGGDDGRPADPGRVDEHLAAAVLLDERGRGDRRDRAARPARRWPGSPRRRPRSSRRASIGHEHVHALGAARLDRARRGRASVERLADELGDRDDRRRSRRPRAGRGRARGGSRGRGRSARTSVGWYSTARWLANHSSVRRSLHSA